MKNITKSGLIFKFTCMITFVVYILLCIYTLIKTNHSASSANTIRENALCLEGLDQFSNTLYQAETGQRGYLLTEKLDYLRPYESALYRIQTCRDNLYKHKDGIAIEQLNEISKLSDQKLLELSDTIYLAKKNQTKKAMDRVNIGDGALTMQNLTSKISLIRDKEEKSLGIRRKQFFEDLEYCYLMIAVLASYAGIAFTAIIALAIPYVRGLRLANEYMRSEDYQQYKEVREYMKVLNITKADLARYDIESTDHRQGQAD